MGAGSKDKFVYFLTEKSPICAHKIPSNVADKPMPPTNKVLSI